MASAFSAMAVLAFSSSRPVSQQSRRDTDVHINLRPQSLADARRRQRPVIHVARNNHLSGGDQFKQALRVHAFTLGDHLHRFGEGALFGGFHLSGHGRAVPPADVKKEKGKH